MNKSQLVSIIADSAEISAAQAEIALNATLESITAALVEGGTVSLVGFGSFGVKKRAARKGRNPKSGAEIMINAASVPYFKAGKNLKEQVDSDK